MLWILRRNRSQHHRVDLAEDRGIGANAECKRENYGGGESRRFRQHTQRVSNILHGLLDPEQRPLIAMSLLRLLHAAVGSLRRDPCFFRRHATAFKFLREQREMRRDLARKFILSPIVAEQAARIWRRVFASEP